MTQLGLLMIDRSTRVKARSPVRRARARLEAIGRAYIEFGRTEPGWFRTAFSSARPHSGDLRRRPASHAERADAEQTTSPYLILGARLDELVDVGTLTPQRRRGAEFPAWSAVHGLSSLLLDGPLRDLPEPQVEHATCISA